MWCCNILNSYFSIPHCSRASCSDLTFIKVLRMHPRTEFCNSQRFLLKLEKLPKDCWKEPLESLAPTIITTANCLLLLSHRALAKCHREDILLLARPQDAHFTWVKDQKTQTHCRAKLVPCKQYEYYECRANLQQSTGKEEVITLPNTHTCVLRKGGRFFPTAARALAIESASVILPQRCPRGWAVHAQ